jgi:Uncharacterized protein conserved in bacteria (DUF2147)
MHWMTDPKTGNDEWKLDTKNPNNALRSRRILGLTILGRLRKGEGNLWHGRLYIPDPGKIPLLGELPGIACDAELTFSGVDANRGKVSVSGDFFSKCNGIAAFYGAVELRRKDQFEGPTAGDATCAYQE